MKNVVCGERLSGHGVDEDGNGPEILIHQPNRGVNGALLFSIGSFHYCDVKKTDSDGTVLIFENSVTVAILNAEVSYAGNEEVNAGGAA